MRSTGTPAYLMTRTKLDKFCSTMKQYRKLNSYFM